VNDDTTAAEAWEGTGPGTLQTYTIGNEPVPPLPVTGIHFAFCAPGQEAALAAAMHEPHATARARVAEGGSAALALTADGRIAGYGWIRYGAIRIDDLPLRLPLPADHAYIWDCLTVPELRGRGIFPGLLRFMLAALQQRKGTRQAWAGVAPGNDASLHAFARAGFRVVAQIGMAQGRVRVRTLPTARPDEVAVLAGRAAHPG
jgi:ribosomal protein S18 acetylase RimI-like enzyme